MTVNQQIIYTGTAGITDYPTAREFVENLPNYLKVSSDFVSDSGNDASIIYVGQNDPSDGDAPFLKLDASGNPIGWFFYSGGSWVPIGNTASVRSNLNDTYIQRGKVKLTLSSDVTNDNNWKKRGDSISFPDAFDENSVTHPVIVQLAWLIESTDNVHSGNVAGNKIVNLAPAAVSKTGFDLWGAFYSLGIGATDKNLDISWVAYGKKA